MSTHKPMFLITLAVFFITACGESSSTKTNETSSTKQHEDSPQVDAEKVKKEVATETQANGILKSIEDGAYPMFTLAVEMEKEEKSFSLNIESFALSMEELYQLEGKTVKIAYKSISEESLVEMEYDGKSLLTGQPINIEDDWQSITGRLEGADVATMSDLPGQCYIIPENGESKAFEYFISAEMTMANLQLVTAFYDIRTYNKVTALEAAPAK